MKTIEIKVYEYDELTPQAQAKARDWYRNCSAGDIDFADCVIDDAETIAGMMGIEFAKRAVSLGKGHKRREACVFWSGFSSQGDGACFEGTWRASGVQAGEVAEYAPKDEKLHKIAAEFERIATEFPQASFSVKHAGRYSHEHCTEFDFDLVPDYVGDDDARMTNGEKAMAEAACGFMRWIYKQIEAAYEYEQSDENVAETIRINEYEFTADGKRFP